MMIHKVIWCLTIFMTVVGTECKHSTISVAGQTISLYRVRTHHPFELYRNNQSNVVADIKDLILELPFEIQPTLDKNEMNKEVMPYSRNKKIELGACRENNGNCSQICEDVNGEAICSCYDGNSILDNGDCTEEVEDDLIILSGTSGNFSVLCGMSYIIKAPKSHIIHLTLFADGSYYGAFDRTYVTDSTLITTNVHNSYSKQEWISNGPYLKLSRDSCYYGTHKISGMYLTGEPVFVSNTEDVAVQVGSLSSDECYSAAYYLPEGVHLANAQYGWQFLLPSLMAKNSQWETHIFRIPKNSQGGSLTLHFNKIGAKFYSLRKCMSIEKYAVGDYLDEYNGSKCLNGGVQEDGDTCICPKGFKGQFCEEEVERKCLNGGSWDINTNTCVCPIGFIGQYCEEGCGPNRYGESCTDICSQLSSKCEGVIFCTEEMCSCAPGFQGVNCNIQCSDGMYGAACKQKCGMCKEDKPCDIYTGKCYLGCATGFHPPLCQQTYKVLQDIPSIAEVGYTYVVLNILFQNYTGGGEPAFYEVQYRDVQDETWTNEIPRSISYDTKYNISGLLPGKCYAVRIVLINKDGGSYQNNIPETTLITKCNEAEQANYYFGVKNVTAYDLDIEWSYSHENNSMACRIVKFYLSFIAGNENFTIPVTESKSTKRINGLLPDTEYSFQLIGETVTGQRVIPTRQTVRTLSAEPSKVNNVQVAPRVDGTMLLISWQPPWNSAETSLKYKVTYECEKFLACEYVLCLSSGYEEVKTNSVLLKDLYPHALYEIKVAAVSLDGHTGEEYAINATTLHAAPDVTPAAAENPLLSVRNTSALLKWMPPIDCTKINGYLHGYSYKLIDKDRKHTLHEESVSYDILQASFSDLDPHHCYEALVTVTASGGTNFENALVIPFCTSSTAPEQVQALEVYKRGRRMVGLRWGLPLKLYGHIESFTITYSKVDKATNRTVVVKPANCKAWPHLYCHTITNLSPGKKYKFVVQARNTEVSYDGDPVSVETITSEGASSPPKNLRVVRTGENSVLLGWEIPDSINGQLRSFIFLAEQIDLNGNSDECFNDIPLQDYQVTSEVPFYTYEVTGLKAASTYSVAVAAKTLRVGEQALITVHTLPPKPKLPENALIVVENEDSSSESDNVLLTMKTAESITGVNRTYILLLLSNTLKVQEELDDEEVTALLHSEFGNAYHIISENTEDEIKEEPSVIFQPREVVLGSEELQSQKYALVLIQEYMGKKSMDVFVAKTN